MKKQIKKKSEALITPLRLTAPEAAALQQLQEYLQIKTRNSAVIYAIKNIMEAEKSVHHLDSELTNCKAEFNQLKQYFLMIDEAEDEIKKILNSNKFTA